MTRTWEHLTQEYLELQLITLMCLEGRRKDLAKDIAAYPNYQGIPVAKTLDDALELRSYVIEKMSVEEEMKTLAGAMMDAGIPDQIWYLATTPNGKQARIKLYTSNGQPFYKLDIAA